MIKPKPAAGLPAIESIEEAIALLRRSSAGTLLCSFIGGVPFWLALLYFVADMSHDALAEERLAGASLTLAVLYLWKKCWQAAYASGLHNVLAGVEPQPWTWARIRRLILTQAQTQFFGLLIRPLAYCGILTLPWASAYYQNVTVLGDGRLGETAPVPERAWAQTRLWVAQNVFLILILGFFLFTVWINVTLVMAAIPFLLKSLLGIETMASRASGAYFNTTLTAATVALSLLLVDPIWTAAYVVRCFHGTSLQTGADLRATLRALRSRATALALVLLMAFGNVAPAAMQLAPKAPVSAVDPGRLSESIDQTLERREFAWRFPRSKTPKDTEAKKGAINGWLQSVGKWFSRQAEALGKKIAKFWRWLKKKVSSEPKPRDVSSKSSGFQIPPFDLLLYIAGFMVVLLLAWAGLRYWRRPQRKTVVAEAVTVLPDLNADDVRPDELPEDGWMQLARELVGRGELRLALRAAYLAGLAHLGQQQFVSIARHKSNLDYRRELRRRARSRAELLEAFDENLIAFERAWYGDHGVTMPIFEQFTQNLERIRAC